MKLNRSTKRDVKVGDVLRFSAREEYTVTGVLPYGASGLCFTIRDNKTGQWIYAYPSSQCYGAEIIKKNMETEVKK